MKERAGAKKEFNPWHDIKNPKKFMDFLSETAEEWVSQGKKDLLPHLVMSHGFMRWREMALTKFPGLGTVGDGKADQILFEGFANELLNRPSFSMLGPLGKKDLKTEGWRAYLED